MTVGTLLVVLAALVAGLLIGWFLGKRTGRKRAATTADFALAAAAPGVLYEVEEMRLTVRFDDNGDGQYVREESGILPRFDMSELIVPYRFSVTPQGSLQRPDVSLLSGSGGSSAAWQSTTEQPTHISGSIVLHGPFRSGERLPGYRLVQHFKKAFFMTREATLSAYRDSAMQREYVGVALYVPTRVLQCLIVFPPGHRGLSDPPSPCAFIGESEFVNDPETKETVGLFQSR